MGMLAEDQLTTWPTLRELAALDSGRVWFLTFFG